MFTHSKTHSDKSTHHTVQPFFSQGAARKHSGSFFTPIATPFAIQRKCEACEEEEGIQAKLTIGQPDDKYEREADAVADRVVSTPDADIQRQEIPEEEETEEIQTKALPGESPLIINRQTDEDEDEAVQTKLQTASTSNVSSDFGSRLQAGHGQGQQLSKPVRNFFEPRFGQDFSHVRIHTNSNAVQLARSINAKAFTHGREIYFNSQEFEPVQREGQHLLAHELTHVVQQRGGAGHLQRLVTCETQEDCTPRLEGESRRSRTTPMDVEIFDEARFGILISNFAVNDDHLKPGVSADSTWRELQAQIGLIRQSRWEILGFTDCPGSEGRNIDLRRQRAEQVESALGTTGAVISNVMPASLIECIDSDASETGRQRNRSVLVRRVAARLGPTPAGPPAHRIGPVRPPGSPGNFCRPYTSAWEADINRTWLTNVWIPGVTARFLNPDVGAMWLIYLSRPKGASLTPVIFRPPHSIAMAFAHDPLTLTHKRGLYRDIRRAANQTPEANVPFSGSNYTSPPIPLTSLLPAAALTRVMNYPDPRDKIPGNLAGGTGASDAGPDQRLISGAVRIERQIMSGARERRVVLIDMQLRVIDAVDFCPGAAGGSVAQAFTIPMSRLEATPTELTYDLPFQVFVNLSGRTPLP